MSSLRAELLHDTRAQLGEGPLWDPRRQCLHWVDILRNEVHTLDPATAAHEVLVLETPASALALRAGGGLVAATQGGFLALDADGTRRTVAEVDVHDPGMRMNDGECDPLGRFWAGCMSISATPGAGRLVTLHPDGSVTTALEGLTVPNGLSWSADGERALFVDSPTGRVDRLQVDPGTATVVDRTPFAHLPEGTVPDGLTRDEGGGVWVALWGGWGVQRLDPDGRPDGIVAVPAAQVTSVAFGGPDGGDLYVTTARAGLTPADLQEQPLAGGVFVCSPGVTGVPPYAVTV